MIERKVLWPSIIASEVNSFPISKYLKFSTDKQAIIQVSVCSDAKSQIFNEKQANDCISGLKSIYIDSPCNY